MSETTTKPKTLTITLTDRPPVRIREYEWTVIAHDRGEAGDDDSDGRGNQPNREWKRTLKVRQHADGRALVYGVYHYSTAFQGERNVHARRGVLLPVASTLADIITAIRTVGDDLAATDDSPERWLDAIQACVADLPAETI